MIWKRACTRGSRLNGARGAWGEIVGVSPQSNSPSKSLTLRAPKIRMSA
jgi:hypothetical protein